MKVHELFLSVNRRLVNTGKEPLTMERFLEDICCLGTRGVVVLKGGQVYAPPEKLREQDKISS